jgi:integrase
LTTARQSFDDKGMPRKLPLHVHKQLTRHKKWVFYYREGKGKRIRLPSPDSPDFKAACRAAASGTPIEATTARSGTLQWLWDKYTMESARWASYSPATQKQQRLIMAKVLEKNANKALTGFTPDLLQGAVDKQHETPAQAGNYLKTMKGMFGWAKKMRLIAIDPTVGVDLPDYKTDGFPPWTVEDVIAFRAKHPIGTHARLSMELMLLAGLRRSDVVVAGRQHIKGRVLSMETIKTGARVTIELSDALVTMIDATPRKGLHLVESAIGRAFTKESFGNWFRKMCSEANVEKSAHGLRKLSATLAAEGGAATHQLLAQYGWTNIATAEIYTKGVDRKRLGIEGSRIVADQIGNIESPHQIQGEGLSAESEAKSKGNL